jgi:hypothetical protein
MMMIGRQRSVGEWRKEGGTWNAGSAEERECSIKGVRFSVTFRIATFRFMCDVGWTIV